MRRRHQHPWLLMLLVMTTVGVTAQETPDFEGRWVLLAPLPDSETPLELQVSQTVIRTTVRGEPMKPYVSHIFVDRRFDSGIRSGSYEVGLQGGQVPGSTAGPEEPKSYQGVRWDGRALLFERGTYTGSLRRTGTWTERLESWSLDADSALRVVITTDSSSGEARTVTRIYERRPSLGPRNP